VFDHIDLQVRSAIREPRLRLPRTYMDKQDIQDRKLFPILSILDIHVGFLFAQMASRAMEDYP